MRRVITTSRLHPVSAILALLTVLVVAIVRPPLAGADCVQPGGVVLNEVRYVDQPDPFDGYLGPAIELYNKGGTPVDLTGWTIRDHNSDIKAALPAVVLPGISWLVVHFGTGTNDLVFSDSLGAYYTQGDSIEVFDHAEGGVALYDAGSTVQDYVTWSVAGSPAVGGAYLDAVNAGLWPAGASVAQASEFEILFSIRRLPDGFRHASDQDRDWSAYGWAESEYGDLLAGDNAIQIDPKNGEAFDPADPIFLNWNAVNGAVNYHLEVFATYEDVDSLVVDQLLPGTFTVLSLDEGTYRWSVGVVEDCGEVDERAQWTFSVNGAIAAPGKGGPGQIAAQRVLGVKQRKQHKDSHLLCIWNEKLKRWWGCTEAAGAAGPWDAAHPEGHASILCPHCSQYCARATVQAFNNYFGANADNDAAIAAADGLSQDRISVAFRAAGDPRATSPEGDLGHDQGALNIRPVLQGAIDNSIVTGPIPANTLTFAQSKTEIDGGYPVYVCTASHALLVDGYRESVRKQVGRHVAFEPAMVHVVDPWPGAPGVPGADSKQGWNSALVFGRTLKFWWRIRPQPGTALRGAKQEVSVKTDTDGDGVYDFDEGYDVANRRFRVGAQRAFQCDRILPDSDGDGVGDKEEIRYYTFHAVDHRGHNPGPNPDLDRLRAEFDEDSDNDRDADGGEDIDQDGIFTADTETDALSKFSNSKTFKPKKAVLLAASGGAEAPGAPVAPVAESDSVFTPSEHVLLVGGTFDNDKTYNAYVYQACPLPLTPPDRFTDATPYAVDVLSTDHDGNIVPADIGTFPPGCYSVALDVLNDGDYGDLIFAQIDSLSPALPDTEFVDPKLSFVVQPSVPVEVSEPIVNAAGGRVHVSFRISREAGASGVDVERARSESGPWALLASLQVESDAYQEYEDTGLDEPGVYWYRIVVALPGGTKAFGPVAARVTAPPLGVRVAGNPAHGVARFAPSVPKTGPARVTIYSARGRVVRQVFEGTLRMGSGSIATWDGRDDRGASVATGMYYVRLTAAGRDRVFKLTYVR